MGCTFRQDKSICPFCRESVDTKEEKVLEREKKLANAGRADAMNQLGDFYCAGSFGLEKDIDEGIKWYTRAMEAGSGSAAGTLGCIFHRGKEVDRNDTKALERFRKAAELGLANSYNICSSGTIYWRGAR